VRRSTRAIWALTALLAVNAVLLVAQPGFAAPWSLADFFFGNRMVRAEVVLMDGTGVHEYRLDRGRIRAVSGASLTVLERDGTAVVVPIAAGADIQLGGRNVPLAALRRGMSVLTAREGAGPATIVRATRK
jgi:hypothetical protein